MNGASVAGIGPGFARGRTPRRAWCFTDFYGGGASRGLRLGLLRLRMRGSRISPTHLNQGMDFPATVAPFILRGVSLLGIDTTMCPTAQRVATWQRMASLVERGWLDSIAHDIPLSAAIAAASDLLAGAVRGRLVVDVARG